MTAIPPTHAEDQRWTVAEITYVLEQRSVLSVRQIAGSLNVPARSVSRLLKRLEQRDQAKNHSSVRIKTPKKNDFDKGLSVDRDEVATSIPAQTKKPVSGLKSPPADLMRFVQEGSVRDVAASLRLSLGAVHQLRHGYWPEDSRRLLRAWSEYKGRTGRVASSWFLRRVRSDGCIAHRGQVWTGIGLGQCVGALVAVACMPDGALLAQTLTLPAQRMPLEPKP